MAEDLNDEIKLSVNASGVETGVNSAKRSINSLGDTVSTVGKRGGEGLAQIGRSGEDAGRKVEQVTRNMVSSLQRQIAAAEAGSTSTRQYQESIARLRGANMDVLKPYLDQLDSARAKTNAAAKATNDWKDGLRGMAPLLATVLSGVSLVAFSGKLVAVQREFDVLNSSLKTVTGSSAAAEIEMAWLKDFAKDTPFGLAQATQGFVKMKALGLDPTKAALTSFGNTASAMGKGLNQMIEAVADASTGEFERLKEFGIKSQKEGEMVAFTFQGVTTKIKNNATEITQYLEKIGDVQFAGAMEERAKTLDGTIAALGDSWDELFRTISSNDIGSIIFDSVSLANGALEDATAILKAMAGAAGDAGKETGALAALQGGLATVFETVAVLGLNVKYVLTQIGNELGGLAAQAVALATGQLGYAAEIGRLMKADAAAARAQVDRQTEAMLNARLNATNQSSALAKQAGSGLDAFAKSLVALPPKAAAAGAGAAAGVGKATKAVKEARDAAAELLNSLRSEELGIDPKYYDQLQQLYSLYQKGAIGVDEYRARVEQLTGKQQFAKDILKQQQNAYEDLIKTIQDASDATAREEETARQQLKTIQDRIDGLKTEELALEKSRDLNVSLAEAIEYVAIARLQEKQANLVEGSAEWETVQREIDARKELIGLLGSKEAREANKRSADDAAKEWEKTSKLIGDTLADYIMSGGRDAASYLKRLFATLVLQPTVNYLVNGVMGMFGLGGGSSGGSGAMGMANNASSLNTIYGAGSQFLYGGTAGASTASLGYANAVGMFGGDSIGALYAANGGWAGVGAGTTGAGAGAGAGIGAAGWAAGILAIPALGWYFADKFDKGDSFSGAAYATSGGNDPYTQVTPGALNPNMDTGDLPDREAMLTRLRALGAPEEYLTGNDRTLHRMLLNSGGHKYENAEQWAAGNPGDEGGGGLLNWSAWSKDNADLPDFYRGQGYASPEQMGWFEQQDKGSRDDYRQWDSFYQDPQIITASRKMAEGILAPIKAMSDMLGNDDAYKVATGMAYNDKTGKITGGLQVWENDKSILNWGSKEFDNKDEYLRSTLSDSLGVLETMDGVPEWLKKQVDGAQEEIAKLEGENIGQRASEIFVGAANSVTATFKQIETLLQIIPDLAGLSQDAVYSIGEAFGSLENYTGAYSGYIQNYYSEDERAKYVRGGINSSLAAYGLSVDESTTREDYRAMIEAQDLTTESGRKAYAALIMASGAFAQITEQASALAGLLEQQADLEIQLMQAMGDSEGAAARRREMETKGFSDAEKAQYDYNKGLERRIEIESRLTDMAQQQGSLEADLMAAMGNSEGAAAKRRELETKGYTDAEKAQYDYNKGLEKRIEIEARLADMLQQQAALEADLMDVMGDSEGAAAKRREMEIKGYTEAEIAQYDSNAALQKRIDKEREFQASISGIGSSLTSVLTEGLLGNLTGADLGGQMANAVIGGVYNALASNAAQQITDMMMTTVIGPMMKAAIAGSLTAETVSKAAIENMIANARAAAEALGVLFNSPEFKSLMADLDLMFKGISGFTPTTAYYQPYAEQVKDYGSAVKESANEAERAAQAIKDAWTSITETLLDQVSKIRGEIADDGGQSLAYWESQFAISTAAARAGDQDAASNLTSLSDNLLAAAERAASSQLELQQMRASVAQSLQDTAGYANAFAGGSLTPRPSQPANTAITPAPVFNHAPVVISADPGLVAEVRELKALVRLMSEQQLEDLRIERKREAIGMPPVRTEGVAV